MGILPPSTTRQGGASAATTSRSAASSIVARSCRCSRQPSRPGARRGKGAPRRSVLTPASSPQTGSPRRAHNRFVTGHRLPLRRADGDGRRRTPACVVRSTGRRHGRRVALRRRRGVLGRSRSRLRHDRQEIPAGLPDHHAGGATWFTTVCPGWYQGRALHIHFKIRLTDSGRTFDVTSQLYFDDALTDLVHAGAPYAAKGPRTLRNNGDGIFRNGGDKLTLDAAKEGARYSATFAIALQVRAAASRERSHTPRKASAFSQGASQVRARPWNQIERGRRLVRTKLFDRLNNRPRRGRRGGRWVLRLRPPHRRTSGGAPHDPGCGLHGRNRERLDIRLEHRDRPHLERRRRVGYRVKEVLFGQDNEAVGRTGEVTGTIKVTGTTIEEGSSPPTSPRSRATRSAGIGSSTAAS